MKRCSKCLETKPFGLFYKQKDKCDGYASQCKLCRREYDKRRRGVAKQTNAVILTPVCGDKTCYVCKVKKPIEQFHRDRSRRDGYNNCCKVCHNNRMVVYCSSDDGRRVISRYEGRNIVKRRAWHAVRRGLETGKLKRMPCIVCGCDAEAHHSDYSKPLDVDWLCREHHKLWHRYLEPFNLV